MLGGVLDVSKLGPSVRIRLSYSQGRLGIISEIQLYVVRLQQLLALRMRIMPVASLAPSVLFCRSRRENEILVSIWRPMATSSLKP